jgi:hypothetical protein
MSTSGTRRAVSPIADYTKIVEVRSDSIKSCPECPLGPRPSLGNGDKGIEELVNHLLGSHGYKLIHVGQDTSKDGQCTVAILGKQEPS